MKHLLIIFALTIPSVVLADGIAKRVYECMYDGGRDASTWQPTGEVAVPPLGAPVCVQSPGDYYCKKVVDANGKELDEGSALGRGMFCGVEMNPDYPGVKAYAQ